MEEGGSAGLELINSFRTPTFISIERLEQVRILIRPRLSLGLICRSALLLRIAKMSLLQLFQVEIESDPDEAIEISSSNSSDEVE